MWPWLAMTIWRRRETAVPLINPPLTTIRQPIHRMGVQAVATLLDLIKNPQVPTPPRHFAHRAHHPSSRVARP
jgi:DNA-binding LacI/PurR family transcriptional regulator